MRRMHEVTERLVAKNPFHPYYPLLPGDLLSRNPDGTWTKECPGLTISGFHLTDNEIATLVEGTFFVAGLTYIKVNDGEAVQTTEE